jgi:hypothetical protein
LLRKLARDLVTGDGSVGDVAASALENED